MCGIFGFWLNRPLNDHDIERGRSGIRCLSHRGPDDEGVWFDVERGLFLGHRRLAILDTHERSSQPMRRGGLAIAFNGELYNFQELRKELTKRGESFGTTGDTEVLLAAWSQWKETAFDRFDGMFAFALDDGKELVFATDPFGEKPLYVARGQDGIWFASEPQPLIDALKLRWQPSGEELRLFLSLGFIPAPRTGFLNLEVMPPATIRRYSGFDRFSERRYWRLPRTEPHRGSIQDISESDIDNVADALIKSLRYRLRSDVPLGLFLSSGVDSALVAALSARELDCRLSTYTVAFPDGVNEAPRAAAIASHFDLPHQVINGQKTAVVSPALLKDLYGVPNDNLSGLAVREMSELARDKITVALSGSGGDELAFGYNKYSFLWKHRRMFKLPSTPLNVAKAFDRVLSVLPHWRSARDYLAGDRTFRYIAVKNSGFAHTLDMLADGLPKIEITNGEPAFAARELDIAMTLPGSYLTAIDRGSMRAGLEVRSPYLNRDVFRAVATIDPRSLLSFGPKSLLRRMLHRYLPESMLENEKRGFVLPIARYISTLSDVPTPNGVASLPRDRLWLRRSEFAAANIILRLGILEQFDKSS